MNAATTAPPAAIDTPWSRRAARRTTLLLVGAVFAVYLPALASSFQFDDWNVIVRDPRVQSLAAWLASMPGIRPLLKLSYALSHALGGGPAGFRLFNIAVHASNAWLVAALLRGFGLRLGLEPATARFAALAAALLFALHPVQTEAVTYVSGRSTSLSALLALAALAAWLQGLDRRDEARWRWASLALFAAALGVKEMPMVLPAVMAAWLWASGAPRTIARRIAPHLLLLMVVAAIVLAWAPYRAIAAASLAARPIAANLMTQVDAVYWLIGQLLWPVAVNGDPALPVVTSPDAGWLLRATPLLALVGFGLWQLRRRPALGFAIVWFFAWLAPTNSLLPRLDVVNDRQLYVAMIGPSWLLGLGLARLRRPGLRRIALAAPCLLLAAATLAHNRVYATEIRYWEDVARKSPGSARAANNLGYAYALACRDTQAASEFQRAMRLDPADFRAPVNLRLLSEGALFADNARHCPPTPVAQESH